MQIGFRLSLLLVMGAVLTGCHSRQTKNFYDPSNPGVINQTYVHKYGMEVPGHEWENRGRSGKVVSTLKSGVVVTKSYVNGLLDGETIYTYPHSGAIEKKESYQNGALLSEQEFFPSGKIKKEVHHGEGDAEIISVWYEQGSPRFREVYNEGRLVSGDYYTPNEQIESKVDGGNGIRTYRDMFGILIAKDKLNEGEIIEKTLYYPNGAPKEIIPYSREKIEGQKKTYLPAGEPLTIENWSNGKQEGVTVEFQHGEKIAEIPYYNGQKNGLERRFKDGQFVVEEVNWNNGKRHGPCNVYVGSETVTSWYYDGVEMSRRQYDRMMNPMPR